MKSEADILGVVIVGAIVWAVVIGGLRMTEPSVSLTAVAKRAALFTGLLLGPAMFLLILFVGAGRVSVTEAATLAIFTLPWTGLLSVAGIYWEHRDRIWKATDRRPHLLLRFLGHIISGIGILFAIMMTLLPVLSSGGLSELFRSRGYR